MPRELLSFGSHQLPTASPMAVRVGPCVFFSTLTGTHPETGLPLHGREDLSPEAVAFLTADRHVDPMEWETVAQSWGIFDAFERGMRHFGGSLDDLVRTNTFYGRFYDYVAFERTRATFLKKDPPASSVMETGWQGVDPRVKLIMHGWGTLQGGSAGFVKAAVTSGKVAAAAAHFSLAIESGPFIWPSGQVGKHPQTEDYVQHWSELPDDVPWLKSGNRHVDHREGIMSAQAWLTYENLRRIVAERGCTLNDVLHETAYVKNMQYLPALDRVRRQLWPDPATAPAMTVVQVNDIGVVPRALLEVDWVALRPDNAQAWRREATVEVDGLRSAMHGPVVTKAGPFRFVAGQHGLLADGGPALAVGQLPGGARSLRAGRLEAERPAEAQSWLIYDRLRRILASQGAILDHLVKVNAYLQDAADIALFQRVGTLALEGARHATATIPVARAGRTPQHALVADAIAYVESTESNRRERRERREAK